MLCEALLEEDRHQGLVTPAECLLRSDELLDDVGPAHHNEGVPSVALLRFHCVRVPRNEPGTLGRVYKVEHLLLGLLALGIQER